MPRRSAATKASANFADQLSSPGSQSPGAVSDDDTFALGGGERHGPSVKFRYGGKRKHPAAPLKVSVPPPPPPAASASKTRALRQKKRTRSRSHSPASSLSPPPSPAAFAEHEHHATKKAKLEKPKSKAKSNPKLKTVYTSALLTPPLGRRREKEDDGKAKEEREREDSPLTELDSPLTPVSAASLASTSPISAGRASPPAFMKSLSASTRALGASASVKKVVATPSTSSAARNGAKRTLVRPHTVSKTTLGSAKAKSKSTSTGNDKYAGGGSFVDGLGSFVFVLLGEDGKVAAGDESDACSGAQSARGQRDASVQIIESMTWWPARISRMRSETNNALQVRLFGDNVPGRPSPSTPSSSFPLASSSSLIPIEIPSASNVRPMRKPNGELSFTADTCSFTPGIAGGTNNAKESARTPPGLASNVSSGHDSPSRPKKRPKSAWQAAVDKMVEAEEQDKDGIPAFISSFRLDTDLDGGDDGAEDLSSLDGEPEPMAKLKNGNSKGKGAKTKASSKSKSKSKSTPIRTVSADLLDLDDDWPDVRAGDCVLSWAPRAHGSYWPARVLRVIEPGESGGKRKYTLEFMDNHKFDLTRDKFFTSDEKGFMTCKLGEWESEVQDVDVPADDDQLHPTAFVSVSSDPPRQRSPTPEPAIPPPSKEDFAKLPLRTQLAYVKPVLLATIRGAYAPAAERHRAFLKGGTARAAVQKDAGVRGEMSTTEVADLRGLISEWALSREGKTSAVGGIEDVDAVGDVTVGIKGSRDGKEIVLIDVDEPEPPAKETEDDVKTVKGLASTSESKASRPDMDHPPITSDSDLVTSIPIILDDPISPQPLTEALPDGKVSDPSASREISPAKSPPQDHADPVGVDKPRAKEDEGSGNEGQQGGAKAAESPTKLGSPIGCEEYESLAGHEKIAYCTDILLREAVQQLHLWRSGERTSVDLLPDAEEARLHAIAVQKMDYRDWVWDVIRMRQAQIRVHKLGTRERKSSKSEMTVGTSAGASGGTRSRPRTATVSRR